MGRFIHKWIMSPVIWIVTIAILLVALLLPNHEPPSRFYKSLECKAVALSKVNRKP